MPRSWNREGAAPGTWPACPERRTGPSAHRLHALLLLALTLLGACSLPLNTAVPDWSRTAGVAVIQPLTATPDSVDAVQEALSTYFYAVSVLWDGAVLRFDDPAFRALAARAAAPEASQAILELGAILKRASDEVPPRWLPRDNSGPTPAYEDRRLNTTVAAADGPVQTLLVILARKASATGTPPPPGPSLGPATQSDDPAFALIAREQAARRDREVANRAADRARDVEVINRIAAGHAVLAARADRLRQRSTEQQVLLAEDHLRRAMTGSLSSQRRLLPQAGS